MNGNERAQVATSTGPGPQGFGASKANWNSNIWGSSGFTSSLRDTAMDNNRARGELAWL